VLDVEVESEHGPEEGIENARGAGRRKGASC
jgi:hypothetical protein